MGAEKQEVSPLISMTYMAKSGKGEILFLQTLSTALRFGLCGAPSSLSLPHPSFHVPHLARCPPGGIKIWALYKWHLEDPLMPSIPQDYI